MRLHNTRSHLIASESVAEREFRPLMSIRDDHPKYVLSMDAIDFSRDGIIHRNIVNLTSTLF